MGAYCCAQFSRTPRIASGISSNGTSVSLQCWQMRPVSRMSRVRNGSMGARQQGDSRNAGGELARRLNQIWRSWPICAARRYAPINGCGQRQALPLSCPSVWASQRASVRSSNSRKTWPYSFQSWSSGESDSVGIERKCCAEREVCRGGDFGGGVKPHRVKGVFPKTCLMVWIAWDLVLVLLLVLGFAEIRGRGRGREGGDPNSWSGTCAQDFVLQARNLADG